MRVHPIIRISVSMDSSWCHNKHAPIVSAIADTGAQANVWSLRQFLAAGFNRSILIPAPDLVAANHSGIKIVGAFFAVIEELGIDGHKVQCHAMVYISNDVSSFYFSQETLANVGVLSSKFSSIGEHRVPHAQDNASITSPGHPIRSITNGCASPNHLAATCACPQRSAVPPIPQELPFPCTPENNPKMREWLPPLTLAHTEPSTAWPGPRLKFT